MCYTRKHMGLTPMHRTFPRNITELRFRGKLSPGTLTLERSDIFGPNTEAYTRLRACTVTLMSTVYVLLYKPLVLTYYMIGQ